MGLKCWFGKHKEYALKYSPGKIICLNCGKNLSKKKKKEDDLPTMDEMVEGLCDDLRNNRTIPLEDFLK